MAAVSTSSRGKNKLIPPTYFNEDVKKEYFKQLSEWVHHHNNSELDSYQRKINDLMDNVEKVKNLKKHKVPFPFDRDQQLLDDTYDMIYVGTKYGQTARDVLLKKKLKDNNIISTMLVLTQDDCLEFFLKEHRKIRYNSDTSKLVQILNEHYVFPKICLDIYLKSCDVCFLKYKDINNTSQLFNKIGQLQVKLISTDNTQIFRYLLIYVDKLTNFKILRPIMINTEEEVSVELFKIFLEFGPPETLHIYENGKSTFYENVFERIKMLLPLFEIKWEIDTSSFDHVSIAVMDELDKWKEENGSKHWEIGCYIVQWKLNSTEHIPVDVNFDTDIMANRCPYDTVFAKSLNPEKDKSEEKTISKYPYDVVSAKSSNPPVTDRSACPELVISKPTTSKQDRSSNVAHTSKQATTASLSTERILPKLDSTKNFAFSIEIMSDESDTE